MDHRGHDVRAQAEHGPLSVQVAQRLERHRGRERVEPAPPYSSGTGSPGRPIVPHSFHRSREKTCSRSRSMTPALSFARAKATISLRSCCWSGV
jgi:hypothetical protein